MSRPLPWSRRRPCSRVGHVPIPMGSAQVIRRAHAIRQLSASAPRDALAGVIIAAAVAHRLGASSAEYTSRLAPGSGTGSAPPVARQAPRGGRGPPRARHAAEGGPGRRSRPVRRRAAGPRRRAPRHGSVLRRDAVRRRHLGGAQQGVQGVLPVPPSHSVSGGANRPVLADTRSAN